MARQVAPGWSLALNSATTSLDDLTAGAAGPAHTLIGSPDGNNVYSAANSSITNQNGPHNPFLAGSATWVLHENGITDTTILTSAIFQFGTTDGANRLTGSISQLAAVPEPASLSLCFGGALLLLASRRLFPKNAQSSRR